jgi:hypothetical protein
MPPATLLTTKSKWPCRIPIHGTIQCIPSDSDSGLDESLIEVVGMCAPPNDGGEVEFAGVNPESFIQQRRLFRQVDHSRYFQSRRTMGHVETIKPYRTYLYRNKVLVITKVTTQDTPKPVSKRVVSPSLSKSKTSNQYRTSANRHVTIQSVPASCAKRL